MKPKKLMSLCRSSSLIVLGVLSTLVAANSFSEVRREKELKITETGLFVDGKKAGKHEPNNSRASYDLFLGQRSTPIQITLVDPVIGKIIKVPEPGDLPQKRVVIQSG